jgi:hypothetical protein
MRFDNSNVFNAVYNSAATRSDQYLEITESGTDHTLLSFVTPCFAAKFLFLSLPLGLSRSCGLHECFAGRISMWKDYDKSP